MEVARFFKEPDWSKPLKKLLRT